jgi:hypothetical protein
VHAYDGCVWHLLFDVLGIVLGRNAEPLVHIRSQWIGIAMQALFRIGTEDKLRLKGKRYLSLLRLRTTLT